MTRHLFGTFSLREPSPIHLAMICDNAFDLRTTTRHQSAAVHGVYQSFTSRGRFNCIPNPALKRRQRLIC